MYLSSWYFIFLYLIYLTNSLLLHCFGIFPGQNTEEDVNVSCLCKFLNLWKRCCVSPRREIQRGCSSEKTKGKGKNVSCSWEEVCARGRRLCGRMAVLSFPWQHTREKVGPTANSSMVHPVEAPSFLTAWE